MDMHIKPIFPQGVNLPSTLAVWLLQLFGKKKFKVLVQL